MVEKITKDNFEEKILKSDIAIIDFYADWCGPCRMMSPVLDEIAKENNILVGKINVDEEPSLAEKYNVMSIPNMRIFKKGKEIKTFVGVTSKEEILKNIK